MEGQETIEEGIEDKKCPLCQTVGRVALNAIGGGAANGGDKYYCYECNGTFS